MSDLLDDLRRLEATATDYGQGRTADAFSRAAAEIARLRAEAAAARLAGWRAGREAAAAMADTDANTCKALLFRAKSRYDKRELLAAVGYQGDPDAECIDLEARESTARDLAIAIRAIPEPEETDDV